MADDFVQIPAVPQPNTAPPVLIRTVTQQDGAGRTVEVQAVYLVDEDGQPMEVMTEKTGREIVRLLRAVNNLLIDPSSGCLLETDVP